MTKYPDEYEATIGLGKEGFIVFAISLVASAITLFVILNFC